MRRLLKMLSLALVACMLLSMVPVAAFAAPEQQSYTDKYGTWLYTVDDNGEITIVGYEGTTKNIVVPRKIGNQWVVALGDGVFKGNTHVCAVDVPTTIKSIGSEAFADCPKLEQVNLPVGLESIGDSAFQNCDSLKELYIPSTVTEIGEGAFAESDSLVVKCGATSYAAEYLLANKEDVNAFTLIQITSMPNPSNTALDTATGAAPNLGDFNPVAPEESKPVTPGENSKPETPEEEEPAVPGEDEEPEVPGDEEPETPEEEEPFEREVPDGKRISYTFGKDGEYTLVMVDTKPDMEMRRYLIYNPNNKTYSVDQSVHSDLRDRFFVVSLTHTTVDGVETIIDLSTDAEIWSKGIWAHDVYNGGDKGYDIGYYLALGRYLEDVDTESYPRELVFDAENRLMEYKKSQQAEKWSRLDEGNTLTDYSVTENTGEDYRADGTVIDSFDSFEKYINRMYREETTLVSIGLEKKKELDDSGVLLKDYVAKNLNINEQIPDTNHQIQNHGHLSWETNEAGNIVYLESNNRKSIITGNNSSSDVILERHNSYINYDEEGNVTFAHQNSWVPVEEGIYQGSYSNYENDYFWSGSNINYWNIIDSDGNATTQSVKRDYNGERVNRHYYYAEEVRAENVNEATSYSNYSNRFSNEPSESAEHVSEITLDSASQKIENTYTDTDTGEVINTETSYTKYDDITDHIYIGETGKYVGWDWHWSYAINNLKDEGTLSYYQVTEYTYESGTDTWKKTETCVKAKKFDSETGHYDVDPAVDFKVIFPENIFDDYGVSVNYYVFDSSDATGTDNWRKEGGINAQYVEGYGDVVNVYAPNKEGDFSSVGEMTNGEANWGSMTTEEMNDMWDDAMDIIVGESTVDDGNGGAISQAGEKEEMLELKDELLESIENLDPEELYQEVVDMVPNGEGPTLDAEVEEETIPESNMKTVEAAETRLIASPTDLNN